MLKPNALAAQDAGVSFFNVFFSMLANAAPEFGMTYSLIAMTVALTIRPVARMGRHAFPRLMPLAFMAVISECLLKSPSDMRTVRRTAIGQMVTAKEGILREKYLTMSLNGAFAA